MTLLAAVLLQQALREFVFHADRPLHSVAIAGTFNGWNKGTTFLSEDSDQRTWRIRLAFEPGKILYKFVLDDNDWITDPSNPKTSDDGNGHVNSVLMILPRDYAEPASRGDGRITQSALRHRVAIPDVNFDRGHLALSLRTRPNDIAAVYVDCGGARYRTTEHPIDELYTRYTATVPWNGSSSVRYAFELDDGPTRSFYGPNGLTPSLQRNEFALSGKTFKPFAPPAWTEHAIIYQIFPDRFANGDKTNDPKDVVPWDAKPTFSNRYGGDVAGVRQHLDYLRSLGVTALYFNPVFASPSNHRYETTDYLRIDPAFGTNQEFGDLTRELAKDGIRTILDGVFNHSATNFFAFKDILDKQQSSKYLSWYTVKTFPVSVHENPPYVAWFNYPSMPKLNVLNPPTKSYLLNVLDYWDQHAKIAGWRLDTGSEVPMDFWRAFRAHLKSIEANDWICGEEWGDATAWLKGDQWDSVMNYPFREAILRFVGKNGDGKPSELLSALMANYSTYAPQVSRNLMNLLGSHDTARILTECGGNRSLAKLAAAIQFTWVGTPSIYYGDEIGMEGDHDPDNRRGMRWDLATLNNDVLTYYRKLISVRRLHPILQSGDPIPLMSDDSAGIAAYGRVLGGSAAVIAINRGSKPALARIDLSRLPRQQRFIDALTGAHLTPTNHYAILTVPACGAAILVPSHATSSSLSDALDQSKTVARHSIIHARHGSKRLS